MMSHLLGLLLAIAILAPSILCSDPLKVKHDYKQTFKKPFFYQGNQVPYFNYVGSNVCLHPRPSFPP